MSATPSTSTSTSTQPMGMSMMPIPMGENSYRLATIINSMRTNIPIIDGITSLLVLRKSATAKFLLSMKEIYIIIIMIIGLIMKYTYDNTTYETFKFNIMYYVYTLIRKPPCKYKLNKLMGYDNSNLEEILVNVYKTGFKKNYQNEQLLKVPTDLNYKLQYIIPAKPSLPNYNYWYKLNNGLWFKWNTNEKNTSMNEIQSAKVSDIKTQSYTSSYIQIQYNIEFFSYGFDAHDRIINFIDESIHEYKKSDVGEKTITVRGEKNKFKGRCDKRDFNSIFFNQKREILNLIETFKNKEGLYKLPSVKHQMGLLLYGPPGTGKTSIIKSIASKLGIPIKSINLSKSNLSDFEQDSSDILIILEDFDEFINTEKNKKSDVSKEIKDVVNEKMLGFMNPNMPNMPNIPNDYNDDLDIQDLMQIMDGICDYPGRVIVATTNHPDDIPKNLIRPGRFDRIIHLGYIDVDSSVEMVKYLFGEDYIVSDEFKTVIKNNNVSPASLEQACIETNNNRENLLKILQKISNQNEFETYRE